MAARRVRFMAAWKRPLVPPWRLNPSITSSLSRSSEGLADGRRAWGGSCLCKRAYLTSYLTSYSMGGLRMKAWPVQDAKARFSEMLDACLRDGPQIVTRRGADAAVLVPMREWQRLHEAARPSLKELLLAGGGRGDIPVLLRGRLRRRVPHALT